MTAIATSVDTNGVSFTTGDTLILAIGDHVVATGSDAISLGGTGQSYDITVAGLLQGAPAGSSAGIWVQTDVTANVTVDASGAVRGDVAMFVDGDASITNHGSIVSTHFGFAIFFSESSTGTHTIDNSGVIYGASVAIDGNLDGVELVTNTGVITGEVNLAGGDDAVHNSSGKIFGKINLEDGDDTFDGGLSAMTISGGTGADEIHGGTHGDLIDGGAGVDALYGGLGKDIFDFNDVVESGLKAGKRDVIGDFKRGQDDIDLSTIDAISGGTDDAFDLLSRGTASSKVGSSEIGFYFEDKKGTANDRTILRINGDDDAKIEMTIEISGLHKLNAGDFVL
jgi:Ca2+-binding RTX toxin-like protein